MTPQTETDRPQYELTLFVSGPSAVSEHAIASARELCDVHLRGRAHLAVIDVHADNSTGLGDGILVTPTLARTFPLPSRRVTGGLSDTARVLEALALRPAGDL